MDNTRDHQPVNAFLNTMSEVKIGILIKMSIRITHGVTPV